MPFASGTTFYQMSAIPPPQSGIGAITGQAPVNIDGRIVAPMTTLPHGLPGLCGTALTGPVAFPMFAANNRPYTLNGWTVSTNYNQQALAYPLL